MTALSPALDVDFPRWRIAVVLGAAVAFYLATMFEVATGREDWPLSPYPMYSDMPGTTASRWTINGVSESGEFKLSDDQTAPFHGSRLLSINKSLERRPAKRAQFIHKLAASYDSRRASEGWPELHAIRFYRETWNLREYAEGIDRPQKELVSAMYLSPAALVARMNAEANGNAKPEPAVRTAAGDLVVDLTPPQCEAGCAGFTDALAASGTAVRLSPTSSVQARTTARVELGVGRYSVFLRVRAPTSTERDRVQLEVDGARAGELGNYRRELPGGAWVWASVSPAEPPLTLEITQAGSHVLRLSTAEALDLDELWLSRSVHELPSDNRVRTP